MEELTKQQLIDRYLNYELSESEQASFEQASKEDDELQKAIFFRKKLEKGTKDRNLINDIQSELESTDFFLKTASSFSLEEKDTESQIEQMIKDRALIKTVETELEQEGYFSKKKTTPVLEVASKKPEMKAGERRIWLRPLAYAASFIGLLLIGLAGFAQLTHSNDVLASLDNEELNLDLREFIPLGNSPQNPQQDASNNWFKAIEQLREKNYKEATALLERIPVDSDIYPDAQLYAAYAYLQLQEFHTAEILARKALELLGNEDYTSRMQADWLLVKALVGRGDPQKELPGILRNIYGKGDHTFAGEAAKLEEKLNSLWRDWVWE